MKYVSTELPPFFLGKRVAIDLGEAIRSLSTSNQNYKLIQEDKKKLDFAFIICRLTEEFQESISSWTLNIPSLGKIGCLPIIDASQTEFSTVNAILLRSTKIASKLNLKYMCLVFDEAVYARIANQVHLSSWRLPNVHVLLSGLCMSRRLPHVHA